jgi:hypothetical protein
MRSLQQICLQPAVFTLLVFALVFTFGIGFIPSLERQQQSGVNACG